MKEEEAPNMDYFIPQSIQPTPLEYGVNWGPYCQENKPCDQTVEKQLCYDVCNETKPYICVKLNDITNVGVTSQSSDFETYVSSLAVDKKILSPYYSKTKKEFKPYWKIDFGRSYNVVAIYFERIGATDYQISCGMSEDSFQNSIMIITTFYTESNLVYTNYKVNKCRYVSVIAGHKLTEAVVRMLEIAIFAVDSDISPT